MSDRIDGPRAGAPARRDPGPLAGRAGHRPVAPAWFDEAMAVVPQRRTVPIAGAGIEVLCWGRAGAPGLLFLHGNGASADWWSFIAPFFADTHRVVASSWSGMGGSQWRDAYSLDLYVQEILGVAEATDLFAAPVAPWIVAHSFGGYPTIACAARHGERFGGATLVDTSVMSAEMRAARGRRQGPPRDERPTRIYPTLAAAIERFRFLPPQRCENLFIADHIARTSLREVVAGVGSPAGFTWRFDPYRWRHYRMGSPTQELREARCPMSMIYGERSQLVDEEVVRYIRSLAPPPMPVVAIPDADHHVMVDQPLAFVAALRALLAAATAQRGTVTSAAGTGSVPPVPGAGAA